MKRSLLVIYAVFYSFQLSAAERPGATPSKLVEIQTRGWYKEKVRAWQSYLTDNGDDKQGWLEYFRTTQYSGAPSEGVYSLAQEIDTRFEGTFEAYYAQAKAIGWTKEGIENLKLALEKEHRSEITLADRILLAEFDADIQSRQLLNQKLLESQSLYPSLLNYSYNVLMSVGHEGKLIVKGEATTIPLWLLQDVMGVRQDVDILNIDLAQNKDYLSDWLSRHQLNGIEMIDDMGVGKLIGKLPELNTATDFYFGLTLPNEQVNSIEERLYVVGLASLHRNNQFDNYKMLKENIENRFLIDYLTVDFNGEPKTATGRVYETNYILPFLLLKEYYDELEDFDSSEKWENIILKLADRSQIKNRVAMLIDEQKKRSDISSFKSVDIEVKELDKKMIKIKGNLYASNVEVTNKEYWFYLDYLHKNGHKNLYEMSKAHLGKYDEYTRELLTNYHYSPANVELAKNPKKLKNSYLQFPAIDMTHEAAKSYCEWLTFQYNSQTDRKYKKVLFRLPTQKEWTISALGYKDFTSWNLQENTLKAYTNHKKNKSDLKTYDLSEYDVLYPWWYPDFNFRDKIQNRMNCYLANIETPDEIVCPSGHKGDGWTLTSLAGAYFPNGLGLYDVIGNVSEMIDQDGKAMGGSYNHPPEESTITSVNKYEGSDRAVGFRLFMEVIEE